jgi:mannose-1-phosphate guanylyltransferase/mannose-6-phosphate isomerase
MNDYPVSLNEIGAPMDVLGDATQAVGPRSDQVSRYSGASVLPVILCGGTGTRLWPVSREGFPKQFWPLISDRSMLHDTALRAVGTLPDDARFSAPLVICNHEHRFLVAAQLDKAGLADRRILLEPVGRNSAPAVAAAAVIAAEQDDQAIMWVMPADAMITDTAALHQSLALAVKAARAGYIVTFGMQPTAPETGFGYIEIDTELDAAPSVFGVARFIEKPPTEAAQRFAVSGRHLWNSGMFVATVATMLQEFETYAPEVLAHVKQAIALGQRDADFVRLDERAFTRCPSISLDYAVAERTRCAAVVPTDFAWSDVGNWGAVWEVSAKDDRGNVLIGDALTEDTDRCLVRTDGRLTAVVGLQDAIIVVTEDAVLAVHRDHAQQVKKIVERLRATGRSEAVAHQRVYRPWGHYESLAMEHRFQVKRIVVDPGQRLSLQKHFHRAEHWVVVRGSALVTRDDEKILVSENESIYLPLGCVHRLDNVGKIPLALIEVQVGSYLGEDDIVRMQDDYGRG